MSKSKSKSFLSLLGKIKNTHYSSALLFLLLMGISTQVHAATPKLVSGTIDLFKAATGWLTLIIPSGAGVFLAYHATQKALSDDQAVIAEKNKLMKNVIIGAAVATTASGLATIILGFYS